MKCPNCGKEISPYLPFCGNCKEPIKSWATIQIETNGLRPAEGCEVLQIIIVDMNQNIVLDEMFGATMLRAWPEAERCNHISPQLVHGKPTLKKSADRIGEVLMKYSHLVTNSSRFVDDFLKAAGVDHPRICGIVEMFTEYQNREGLLFANNLNTCAKFFNYDKPGKKNSGVIEKAKKIAFCYENMSVQDGKEIIGIMGHHSEIAGFEYEQFIAERQILDYLKHLGVVGVGETKYRLYYDGRHLPDPTRDVFPLGLQLDDNGEPTYIVLLVKDRTVAVEIHAFVEMQARCPKYAEAPEGSDIPSIFDLADE